MHGFGTITDRKGAKYKGNFYNGLRYDSDDDDDDDGDNDDDDDDDDDNDDDTLPRDIMIMIHELLT